MEVAMNPWRRAPDAELELAIGGGAEPIQDRQPGGELARRDFPDHSGPHQNRYQSRSQNRCQRLYLRNQRSSRGSGGGSSDMTQLRGFPPNMAISIRLYK